MSADVLREAAALMRSRAEAATPGEYTQGPLRRVDRSVATLWTVNAAEPELGGRLAPIGYTLRHKDAQHIASWHPAVALAVADWLEAVADEPWCCDECKYAPDNHNALVERAVATARAYLGTTP